MRNRLSMIVMLTLCIILGVIAPASAQTLPLPAVGQTKQVFITPSVLRALQGAEKNQAPSVRVIVSFETRGGRSGAMSVEDISTAAASILSALPAGSYEVVSTFNRIPSLALKINEASLTALRSNPLVYAINADQVITTYMTEANALTGVASVHAGGITGQGAVVAIIDTGVDSASGVVHPALADDILGQACFRTENDCIGGATSAEDQGGHGTHVAGIITGSEGVAPDAMFYALKVFTTGSTSDTNILNALDYVIALNTTTPGTVDLINMSLGGDNFPDQASCDANSAAYVSAFSTLNGQGVTNFVATGNDAQITEIGSPGCVTGAVGVGSVSDAVFTTAFGACTENGAADKVTCFSNATPVQGAGELVDLMAPGCTILSAWLDAGTNSICGTSMATPYAAGTAALLVEYLADNSLSMTPAQIEAHMEATGVQVSDYRMDPGAPTFPRVSPPAMIGSLAIDEPTGFSITGTTLTTVSTAWTASAGAVEYRVYASKDGGAPFLAGTVTAPTIVYTDTSADCGTLTYFVRAFDGSFESVDSNTDTDTARACPLAPSGLVLTIGDFDTHTLTWTDNNPDETSNILQRNVNGAGYTDYQTLAAGVNITYTDDLLACGVYQYRAVSERNGDLSSFSNVVQRAICAPANDDFTNAEVVPANVALTDTEANQSYGTEEIGDPDYSCHFGSAGPGFQGVWYSITPAVATRVTVSTAATTIFAPSAGFPDTLVGIYTGTLGSLSEIACNDDISDDNYRSTVSSNLDAGITYYVFVSQWVQLPPATVGNLVTAFTWSAPIVVPDNDLVANARVITGPSYTNTVASAQNATTSGTDLAHTCRFGSAGVGTHTVWWTFTAPSNGKITVDTLPSSGSYTDTIMTIYTGTSGSFTQVACNDDEPAPGTTLRSEIIDLAVTGGTTYTVYVSRYSATATATAGTVVLNLGFTADPIPAGVTIAPTTADVSEAGTTDTYTVVLNAVPSGDVIVTPVGDADCTVSGALTFTTGNFAVAQTVTVTAVDDAIVEGAHTCTITHSAAGGGYDAVVIASVTGNVTDNDSAPMGEELLTNPGFETAGATAGIPLGWTVQAASGDKRACPANVNNVHGGTCAFKFTGSVTDVSKLTQNVDLTGVTFTTGDTLVASAFFKGNHTTAKIKVTLFVYYTGNTIPVKTSLIVRRNIGFIEHTLPVYTLTSAAVSQIKLVFNHQSSGGTIWVDDASLYQTYFSVRSADPLGLPSAPDGFRK